MTGVNATPQTQASTVADRTSLVLAHAHAQLGTFISSVTDTGDGWYRIRSDQLPNEPDWNFDVLSPGASAHPNRGALIWDANSKAERQPRPPRFVFRRRVAATEQWMLHVQPRCAGTPTRPDVVDRVQHLGRPDNVFASVFEAGFDLHASESDNYRLLLMHSTPPTDVHTTHLVLWTTHSAAAIASVHVTARTAFLYNVTTHPTMRGLGIAHRIIDEALAVAHESCANQTWLQCAPDTPAARIYTRHGFETQFTASFVRA